jgi:hypothetical protein
MTVAAPRHPAFPRVGGSIGTALLALILQQQTRLASSCTGGSPSGLLQPVTPTLRAEVADPLAHAFTHTLGWSAPITAAAIILIAVQAWSESRTQGDVRDRVRERTAPPVRNARVAATLRGA